MSSSHDPVRESDAKPDATSGDHDSLKYHLLGPSLTKAGQELVDQTKVSDVIYNASKGSMYFNREEAKDQILTQRIERMLEKKRRLERLDLTRELRSADQLIAQLEASRDLTQHIVHVDCDAFYAAVEQLDRPELREVPFAVGGGVLTTCNYLARKYGCRSGMAGFVAKKLCPELLLIPLNFDKYTSKAHEVREVLADYDARFESASIDEAYLNITEYCTRHDMTPDEVVQQLRDEIHEKTKITVSAGIAANARLAKICSNMNKPNGQYLLPSDRHAIMAFMRDLPTRKVNGIGRVLERELLEMGVKTCGDIFTQRKFLRQLLGDKTYEFLITSHLGLGRTNVQPAEEYERKSVGTESTFRGMSDPIQLRQKLRWIADELEKDMVRAECKGRTLVLKIKLHTYEVFTRQVVTPKAVYLSDDLYNHSLPILTKLEHDLPGMTLRLMGLRCTNLVGTKKPDARAFFGLTPRPPDADGGLGGGVKRKAVDAEGGKGEWEAWPEGQCGSDQGGEVRSLGDNLDDVDVDHRHHCKEVVSNPDKSAETKGEEEWWGCPICSRPQAADERQFNEHIDLCLSRQTIRETVQRDAISSPAPKGVGVTDAKRMKTDDSKRGKQPAPSDPRQKKLSFG